MDPLVGTLDMEGATAVGYDAVEVNEAVELADDGTVEILLSFPRPLIPLLEFL